MTEHQPIALGNNVFLIDLLEQNHPCRSGAYVIVDKDITVIETGSSLSHETLTRGITALGIHADQIKYIAVTHVHLDHAGGAGHLMKWAPNATLLVHPRGQRHMANPEKLWEGAKGVYGEQISELFGSILPIADDRIRAMNHKEDLCIGNRTLTFFDSPGHAKHHFTILDPLARALYAGDAVGIRYRTGFTGWDFEWVMPSSSPIDFDPDAVSATMRMLHEVDFDWVYHTHFGASPKTEAMKETERLAWGFANLIEQIYKPDLPLEEVVTALRGLIRTDLSSQGFSIPDNIEVLDIDVILDSLGLMYFEARRKMIEQS